MTLTTIIRKLTAEMISGLFGIAVAQLVLVGFYRSCTECEHPFRWIASKKLSLVGFHVYLLETNQFFLVG